MYIYIYIYICTYMYIIYIYIYIHIHNYICLSLSLSLSFSLSTGTHRQGGEKVRTDEQVRRCEYEPPSEPVRCTTDYFVNRHETVQVRRYEYEPARPPPRPDQDLDLAQASAPLSVSALAEVSNSAQRCASAQMRQEVLDCHCSFCQRCYELNDGKTRDK